MMQQTQPTMCNNYYIRCMDKKFGNLTMQECIDYFLDNQDIISLTSVAHKIAMDKGNFSRGIRGVPGTGTAKAKIPDKYLPLMQQIIADLHTIKKPK